ncbi:MAG: peptidylprolyl isomerase [Acidobacteria bacterium]|nr:peptidylprolyl isomerase [Planctomycetota bacterium]MBE3133816.1 peptidylprolyl isomerase [Acidobacteriota bacterium]
MRIVSMALMAALAGLVAAGCNRGGRDFGSLTPRAAGAGNLDSGTGRAGEEVNPVQAPPATLARTQREEAEKPATPTTLTRPGQDASYDARLEDVVLPMPAERPPVLADTGGAMVLVDTVLAEVNGEVITREDILGPIRPQMEQWRKEYDNVEAFESRCRQVIYLRLREAVSRRLVVQEAKARLTDQEKEQIEFTLGQMLKDMVAKAGSAMLLEEQFTHEGSTLDAEKDKERERLMVQRYLREKIAPTVHVTHSDLLALYREVRPERYVVPAKARLALVMIKKSEFPDEAQALALAQAVHERATAGEDFGRLAARYSRDPLAEKGGDWGLITKGSFRLRAVDDVLFALEKGQVGPLVAAADAFYVVKALDVQPGRTVPFTEVQGELEDEIRDRKYNETVSSYISDLYKRSYVRIMMENL